jgi:hypothetical protein
VSVAVAARPVAAVESSPPLPPQWGTLQGYRQYGGDDGPCCSLSEPFWADHGRQGSGILAWDIQRAGRWWEHEA